MEYWELDYDDELMTTLEVMVERQEVDFGTPYMQCTGRGRTNFPSLFSVIAKVPLAARMARMGEAAAKQDQAVHRRVGKGRAQLLKMRQKQRQLGMVQECSSPPTPGSSDLNSVRSAPVVNDQLQPIPRKVQDIAGNLLREGSNLSIPQSCQSLPSTHPAPPPARSRSQSQPRAGRGKMISARSAKRETSELVSYSFAVPKQKLLLPKDTVVTLTDEDYVRLGKSKAAMWLQSDFKHVGKVSPSNHPKLLKEEYKRDRANINQDSLDRLLRASANFTTRSDGDASSGLGKGKNFEWPKKTSSVEVTASETFPSLASFDVESYDQQGQMMRSWGEESLTSLVEKQQESQSVVQGDGMQGKSAPIENTVQQERDKDTEIDDFAKRENNRRWKEGREVKAAQTVNKKSEGKLTPPEMDNTLEPWHKVGKSQSPPNQFRAQSVAGLRGDGTRDQFDDASSPLSPEGLDLFIDLNAWTNTSGSTPMPEFKEDGTTRESSFAFIGVGYLPPGSSASDTSTFPKFNEMSLPRAALSELKQRYGANTGGGGDSMNPAVTSPQHVVCAAGDGAGSGGGRRVDTTGTTTGTGTVSVDKGRNLPFADNFQNAEGDAEQKEANNSDEEEPEPTGTVVVRNIPTSYENKEQIYDIVTTFGGIDSYQMQEMDFDMLEVIVTYKKRSAAQLMKDCLDGQDGLFVDNTLAAELLV